MIELREDYQPTERSASRLQESEMLAKYAVTIDSRPPKIIKNSKLCQEILASLQSDHKDTVLSDATIIDQTNNQ